MNIAIIGISGRMGKELVKAVTSPSRITMSLASSLRCDLPKEIKQVTFSQLPQVCDLPDVWIDFSRPECTLRFLEQVKKPTRVVIGTTGFSNEQMKTLENFAKETPIFFAANMSLGMNWFYYVLETTLPFLDSSFTLALSETHHLGKVDSPSGTAKKLVQLIEQQNRKVSVTSFREGNVIGEHVLRMTSAAEKIVMQHQVTDRSVFALGALTAAKYLARQTIPGFYNFKNIFDSEKEFTI